GPIQLGHLLDDLVEFVPLNRDGIVEIPSGHLNKVDTKNGFKTSRSKLVSGELGVVAKVVGLAGVGAGADTYYKKDKNNVLSCKTIEAVKVADSCIWRQAYQRASLRHRSDAHSAAMGASKYRVPGRRLRAGLARGHVDLVHFRFTAVILKYVAVVIDHAYE
ncbi:hypothetical protein TOPH_04722, partial [Tolypocladium ophioglossoides CBS 100239]